MSYVLCLICRGFSYVDLVEEAATHKMFALKRLTCHSPDEERIALQEVQVGLIRVINWH